MRRGRIVKVRREGQSYSLFFIKPKSRIDANRYAEKLASMEDVEEVMMTEGECGFIVKTRDKHEPMPSNMAVLAKTSYKRINSYYQYKK